MSRPAASGDGRGTWKGTLLACLAGLAAAVVLLAVATHLADARNHDGMWIFLGILGALTLADWVRFRNWLHRWQRRR